MEKYYIYQNGKIIFVGVFECREDAERLNKQFVYTESTLFETCAADYRKTLFASMSDFALFIKAVNEFDFKQE